MGKTEWWVKVISVLIKDKILTKDDKKDIICSVLHYWSKNDPERKTSQSVSPGAIFYQMTKQDFLSEDKENQIKSTLNYMELWPKDERIWLTIAEMIDKNLITWDNRGIVQKMIESLPQDYDYWRKIAIAKTNEKWIC